MKEILWACFWFALLGGGLGIALAVADRFFAVKTDEKEQAVRALLPGANCGACGNSGCDAMAKALCNNEANLSACRVCGEENAEKISALLGQVRVRTQPLRAQVMCSGTTALAKRKYDYEGAKDCISASRLGGGAKDCPYGCVGLGTCVSVCAFDAIHVLDGVARVEPEKCQGCGMCALSCPKHLIKLIPRDSQVHVGCMSADSGAVTRRACEAGCIGCRRCEKACEQGAIAVTGTLASIRYEACIGCMACVEVCPRKVIHQKGEKVVLLA